jgi:hypothetical protein
LGTKARSERTTPAKARIVNFLIVMIVSLGECPVKGALSMKAPPLAAYSATPPDLRD